MIEYSGSGSTGSATPPQRIHGTLVEDVRAHPEGSRTLATVGPPGARR